MPLKLLMPEDQPKPAAITKGASCWLQENDCFGSITHVVVVKIFPGGNARVREIATGKERECGTANLKHT